MKESFRKKESFMFLSERLADKRNNPFEKKSFLIGKGDFFGAMYRRQELMRKGRNIIIVLPVSGAPISSRRRLAPSCKRNPFADRKHANARREWHGELAWPGGAETLRQ